MGDQRTVSKNIAGTFLVQIPNYVLGLVAGIFLTRQLGPEGKGIHTILITNVQLLVMFLGLNLSGAIQFFVANKKIGYHSMLSISFLVLLSGSLIVFVLLFLAPQSGDFLLERNYDTFFFRVYIFISFFITNLNTIISGFLQGHQRFKEVNQVSFINSILNFFIFMTLYFLSLHQIITVGLTEVLIFTMIILLLNTILLIFFLKIKVGLKLHWDFKGLPMKELSRFLVPAYFSVLINFFNYRLTIWMVNYFEGNEQLGYFSLALNFAQMMLMVTLAINTVLFPYFASKQETDGLIRDFKFAFKINMLIMFFASLFLLIFSSLLIPLFYSDIFIPSIEPVQILAVGTFFCSLSQVFGHFFGARNKNWINTLIYIFALVSLSILGYFLIPAYGISGAAWASGGSYVVMLILFLLLFRMHYKVSIISLFVITKEDIFKVKEFFAKRKL